MFGDLFLYKVMLRAPSQEFANLGRISRESCKNLGKSLGKSLGSCLEIFVHDIVRCSYRSFGKILQFQQTPKSGDTTIFRQEELFKPFLTLRDFFYVELRF